VHQFQLHHCSLDDYLDGGIYTKEITEVVGEVAAAKTQVCSHDITRKDRYVRMITRESLSPVPARVNKTGSATIISSCRL
jgi:hypothetical protein